jgi:hypothetical protein
MCKENGWLTYPDVDERLIFPGPFYIECPEFDAAEASRRMVQAKTVLGVDGYYSETKAETLMSILAGALLGYGLLKVSPVRLGNKFTKGSYPPEITPEGVKFKWSKPRSSITISPVSSRAKKLLVKVHSIADKQMTIKANNLIRYDDSIKAGDNELTIELGKAYPLNSKLELEFITPPTIPCEIDMNSRDNRELGIVIRWLKLL